MTRKSLSFVINRTYAVATFDVLAAAGAFMLVLRPFKVGDFVQAGGITGTVQELGLFGTTIVTPDNVLTLVGNGKIFADTIQNFSALPFRRVDRTAQLAGGVDHRDAIARFTRDENLAGLRDSGARLAQRLDPHRPYIFAANHQSQFDIPALVLAMLWFRLRDLL